MDYPERGQNGHFSAFHLVERDSSKKWPVVCYKLRNQWIMGALRNGTMKFASEHLNFSEQYLQATLFVSLLSVWLLVGLFYYLNRYTKREYFTVWTTAWLFYALWLTLGLTMHDVVSNTTIFMLRQCCVAISAVFLLWGSARFLSLPIRQSSFGLFMLFLLAWTFVSPEVLSSSLQIQLPVFILIGLSSVFAGVCFFRVRKRCRLSGPACCPWAFCFGDFTWEAIRFPRSIRNFTTRAFLSPRCCSFLLPSAWSCW